MKIHVAAIWVGLLVSPVSGQDKLPAEFLAALPARRVDDSELVTVILQDLPKIADASKKSMQITKLGNVLPNDAAIKQRVRPLIETSLASADPGGLYTIGAAVAHYPMLRQQLLDRAVDEKTRGYVLERLARNVPDFAAAKQYCDQIPAINRRVIVLAALVPRAPTLAKKIEILKETFELELATVGRQTISGIYPLHRYAIESSAELLAFLDEHVAADEAIPVYVYFANYVSQDNPTIAKRYLDKGWSRIDQCKAPHAAAQTLLERDYREVDQATWIEKFDRYILPELAAAKIGIRPLSYLAKFDMELMIDRTRKSCVHPARPFERIFPSVLDDAFLINPHLVLTWLETTDSPLKDRCVHKVVEYLTLPEEFKRPSHQGQLQRLMKLANNIENPQQRLDTLARLAEAMHRLGAPWDDAIREAGQDLLTQNGGAKSVKLLQDDGGEALFRLCNADVQWNIFDRHLKMFQSAEGSQAEMKFESLSDFIATSELADSKKLEMLKRMQQIASAHANPYLQAKIASHGLEYDSKWAMRTMWSILPEDRGRSGKTTYIDWMPAPYDTVDAIRWFRQSDLPERRRLLTTSIGEFLPEAPDQDKDALRAQLCALLVEAKEFSVANGLASRIADPYLRVETALLLLGREK